MTSFACTAQWVSAPCVVRSQSILIPDATDTEARLLIGIEFRQVFIVIIQAEGVDIIRGLVTGPPIAVATFPVEATIRVFSAATWKA